LYFVKNYRGSALQAGQQSAGIADGQLADIEIFKRMVNRIREGVPRERRLPRLTRSHHDRRAKTSRRIDENGLEIPRLHTSS
jgi:hypothetical protein